MPTACEIANYPAPQLQVVDTEYIHKQKAKVVSFDVFRQKKQAQGKTESLAFSHEQGTSIAVSHERNQPQALEECIAHFDSHWWKEGLPEDWYNLRGKVGFSIRTQMNLLTDTTPSGFADFAQQNEQDLKFFCLEYLSQHLVYPIRYNIQPENNAVIDLRYKKDMKDIVSDQERNGVVKLSILTIREDARLEDTPDGTLYGYASPLGPTGLQTDDGEKIAYLDSYWFLFQKQGRSLVGCTIKTDFSLAECREGVKALSGIELTEDAPLEAYTETTFRILPQTSGIQSLSDIVHKLQTIPSNNPSRSTYAFNNTSWESVYWDLDKHEQLYRFNNEAQACIDELTAYTRNGTHTKQDLQKALAATFLRISKFFIEDDKQARQMKSNATQTGHTFLTRQPMSFGQVLDEVQLIPGCAGGGKGKNGLFDPGKALLESLVPRIVELFTTKLPGQEGEWFNCPKCNYQATGPVGNSCPSCNLTKEGYAQEGGKMCD